MLAARTSTVRSLQRAARQARSFASVADSAGVKVAAVDYNQPTSSVTVLVKAGSRFETKPGVANALKNFAFKSTTKRSAIGSIREAELYGGLLTSSLTREHLAVTAEFLRGDEAYFVDLLTSFITDAKFARWEFEEYVSPLVEGESEALARDHATQAVELAHALAFRNGLGKSLFAPAHSNLTVEDVKAYAATAFSKGNVAVIGTGISQETLSSLVDKAFAKAAEGTAASSPASAYYGGETRVASHAGPQTVFVGFGTTGANSAELAALAAHLSPSTIKWSKGLSPLAELPEETSVQPVYLPYTDATLFGLLVQGSTAEGVKAAATKAVAALKQSAQGLKAEEVKSAVAKAKFAAAAASETREGLVSTLGSKLLAGSEVSLTETLSALEKVDASSFSKAAASLIASKPTFVVVGDLPQLPYADEIGL